MSRKKKQVNKSHAQQSTYKESKNDGSNGSVSEKIYKVEIVSASKEKNMMQTIDTIQNANVIQSSNVLQISDIIQIVIALLTLFSVIIVLLTLFENQKARNMAYKPFIVMNPINISIKWDSNGFSTWLTENSKLGTPITVEQDENTVHMQMHMSILEEDTVTGYTVVNIGVGTAKDISFKWDTNNLSRLNEYLVSIDDKYSDFFQEGEEQDSFQIGESLFFTNKIQESSIMYMLSQASEPWTLYFPIQYRILIEELIKQNNFNPRNFPLVILQVNYSDIQGKNYPQFIAVRVNRSKYLENKDGSGEATYQLTPINSKD